VYFREDHGLTREVVATRGEYNYLSDPRLLGIYQPNSSIAAMDPLWLEAVVVHECTHAVQDWEKVPALDVIHSEADAYIAEWVVRRSRGQNEAVARGQGDLELAAFNAAKFVIENKPVSESTYRQVVKEIKKLYTNGKFGGGPNPTDPSGKPIDQKKVIEGLLGTLYRYFPHPIAW